MKVCLLNKRNMFKENIRNFKDDGEKDTENKKFIVTVALLSVLGGNTKI